MITVKNLTKSFSTPTQTITALRDINLHIPRGEIYGIIGKSGAGKSTLIRCMNLLEKPTTGQIFIDQQELTTLSSYDLRMARRKIGMIFQHFNLLATRTAYDNIALPLELAGLKSTAIKKTVLPLLELTGLQDKQFYYPAQLSGGQKQRVAIARALAYQPSVLLSDEATSALDPETTLSILDLLKNIKNALNITILLITHEMSVIKSCCDRVGILSHGELIEENEVGTFFSHPQTEIAKSFIVSSLIQHLPTAIADHVVNYEKADTHPILRLWFFGNAATEPVMAQLINQFQLQINILQANVEYIKKHAMGIMILAIKGDKQKYHAAIRHIEQLGVQVEVLGHVPDNIISFA